MSEMTDAINRIATCAERRNFISCIRAWMMCSSYEPSFGSNATITTKDIKPEQLKEIEQAISRYPPRLSLNQISEITKDYPFQLTTEVCELYQRGNGCLPLGLDNDATKDWNSFDNYFWYFPSEYTIFYPLERAIDMAIYSYKYQCYKTEIEKRLLFIFSHEYNSYAVLMNEARQETSPVFVVWEDSLAEISPSLTNLILAQAEIMEQEPNWNPELVTEEIKAICWKYRVKRHLY